MSFGHGKSSDDYDYRAIPLGVGALTHAKDKNLILLRDKCLEVSQHFGTLSFDADPLRAATTKADMTKRLLASQKDYVGLNKVYVERMRTQVVAAQAEQNKRFFKSLIGRLAYCSGLIPESERRQVEAPETPVRRYYHVPLEIQDTITEAELQELEALAPEAKALYQRVLLAGNHTGLTPNQVAVLTDIHARVLAKHSAPEFGRADSVVQLPLDYRVIVGKQPVLTEKLAKVNEHIEASVLLDAQNARYTMFLEIAHPVPRNPAIRIPMTLEQDAYDQLCLGAKGAGRRKRFDASSFTLELGPYGQVTMRLVVTQPKQIPRPLETCNYVMSRDFGMVNTVSLSVIKLQESLDAVRLAEIKNFSKVQAHEFLTSHAIAEAPIALRVRYSGRGFLDRINQYCDQIDGLRSRIDTNYLELAKLKTGILASLGLSEIEGEIHLMPDMAPIGHEKHSAVRRFLFLLGQTRDLKRARTRAYNKIGAIKRAWFGFLSNIETQLALDFEALVLREDLDYVTKERGSPGYKGRTFNKMINNTARGKYARTASAKFQWNGIPELTVPAYYTSTTCTRHARVDAKMRNNEVFKCPACHAAGLPAEHADEHAADTIGLYPLLKPLSDKHSQRASALRSPH